MLVLGREPGEYVVIGGNIVVRVVKAKSGLKLAIDAPREMTIERGEVYEQSNPRPEGLRDEVPCKKASVAGRANRA